MCKIIWRITGLRNFWNSSVSRINWLAYRSLHVMPDALNRITLENLKMLVHIFFLSHWLLIYITKMVGGGWGFSAFWLFKYFLLTQLFLGLLLPGQLLCEGVDLKTPNIASLDLYLHPDSLLFFIFLLELSYSFWVRILSLVSLTRSYLTGDPLQFFFGHEAIEVSTVDPELVDCHTQLLVLQLNFIPKGSPLNSFLLVINFFDRLCSGVEDVQLLCSLRDLVILLIDELYQFVAVVVRYHIVMFPHFKNFFIILNIYNFSFKISLRFLKQLKENWLFN
jgi:hypothetical protein